MERAMSLLTKRKAKLAGILQDEIDQDTMRKERHKDGMRRRRVQEQLGLRFRTDEDWKLWKEQEEAKVRLWAEAPYSIYRPGQRRCFSDLPEEVLALIVEISEWPAMLMRVNRTMLRVAGRVVYTSGAIPTSNPPLKEWAGADLAAPTHIKPFGGDLKRSLLGFVEHLKLRVDMWTTYQGIFLSRVPEQYDLFPNLKTLVMFGPPHGRHATPIRTCSVAQFCSRVSTQHACITDRLARGLTGLTTQDHGITELWFSTPPKTFTSHDVRCSVLSDWEAVSRGPVLPCYGTLNVIELSHHAGYKRRAGDDDTAMSSADDEHYDVASHPVPSSFRFKAETTQKLVKWLCDILVGALPELHEDEESQPVSPEEQALRDKTTWRFVLPPWWNSVRPKGLRESEYFEGEILNRLPSMRGRVTCSQLAPGQTTECLACLIQKAEGPSRNEAVERQAWLR